MILPRTPGLLVALLLALSSVLASDERPNIVFILIDDLRWDALGYSGHPFSQTPNIDRIAREGANFRNAFVTTPLCFPSRASILTGQYTHRHGIVFTPDRESRSHRMVTFPMLLHQAGYETAFIGKWHLKHDNKPAPGIDRWVSFHEQGEYLNPKLYIDGSTVSATGYLTDILTDHAVEFIGRKRTKPFMMYLSHKAVHAPFIPATRHKSLYADIPLVRPASVRDTWEGKPVLKRPGVTLDPKDTDTSTSEEDIRNQLRMLVAVDEGVKRIVDALQAAGELDRTVILFTSDNGYFWGEHGLGGKHGAYEESIRVPLLVRYPKLVKAGSRPAGMALNIDIAPTLLDLAGQRVPKDMQGVSLVPSLKNESKVLRSSFLAEFFLGNGTPRFPTWQAVREERWKYIHYVEMEEMNELYDLQSDPMELRNLINDRSAARPLKRLKGELKKLLGSTR